MIKIATRIVKQWDEHDRFRDFDNHGEPDEVRLARAYLTLFDRQSKHSDYAINLQRFLFALAKGYPVPEVGLDTHARTLALQVQAKLEKIGQQV
jgi:hypothetical protein